MLADQTDMKTEETKFFHLTCGMSGHERTLVYHEQTTNRKGGIRSYKPYLIDLTRLFGVF